MDHFAGLDVSVKETSVCIVDDTGKIIREVKVATRTSLAPLLANRGVGAAEKFFIDVSRRTPETGGSTRP